MADLAQLESALVKADAAGDAEGARILAAEIRKMRSSRPSVGSSGSWTEGPTDDQKLQASVPARMVQGVRDVIDAGAQGITKVLPEGVVSAVNRGTAAVNKMPLIGPVTEALGMTPATPQQIDEGIRGNEQQYQQARKATGNDGIDFARLGGNLAVTAPAAAALPVAPTLLGKTGIGAASGAGFGLTQPVVENQDNFFSEKAKQAGVGALAGGVAAPIGAGVARVVQPNTRPQVKALMAEGITPTPGQILGGALQKFEDKATSIPIVGDAIASAQKKGINEFNRAMYSRALDPIGGQVPQQVGREGVASVKQQLGQAYDDLLPKMGFAADEQFTAQMANLDRMAKNLPKREAREFSRIIKEEVTDRLTGSGLGSGETLKTIESQLGKEIGRFSKSPDAYQQKLSEALREAQSTFREAVKRANPQFSKELKNIDKGYANYARIRDAASRQGSAEGVVTPAQLAAAVRAGDKTAGKGGYATGGAFMQDLSDAGKDVLASKYPNSGTAGRLMAGTGAAGASYLLEPSLLTGAGLASLPYLPGGRQAVAALLAKRPEQAAALAEALRNYLPPMGAAAAPALLQSGPNGR
jgi:hypothetical protein